jgi:hypothetical protein
VSLYEQFGGACDFSISSQNFETLQMPLMTNSRMILLYRPVRSGLSRRLMSLGHTSTALVPRHHSTWCFMRMREGFPGQ